MTLAGNIPHPPRVLAPPDDLLRYQLAQLHRCYLSVSAGALAVNATSLRPIAPLPAWLPPVQAALTKAQDAAENWLQTIGARSTAELPEAFIAFSSRLTAEAETIRSGKPDDAQFALARLAQMATANAANAQAHFAEAQAYAAAVRALRPQVEGAITQAATEAQADEAQLIALRNSIGVLLGKLSAQGVSLDDSYKGIATSTANIGIAVITFSFAATAGAATVPFVGLAMAAATLTWDSIQNALTDASVMSELAEVGRLQGQLTVVGQQLAALHGIGVVLQNLDHAITSVGAAVDLAPVWHDTAARVGELRDSLQIPGLDPRQLPAIRDLEQAVATWKNAATWAGRLQLAAVGRGPAWTGDLATVARAGRAGP
ncbi:MAG: hypothetical protein RLZZ15_4557 [Verrucomicrobiota bacterium]